MTRGQIIDTKRLENPVIAGKNLVRQLPMITWKADHLSTKLSAQEGKVGKALLCAFAKISCLWQSTVRKRCYRNRDSPET